MPCDEDFPAYHMYLHAIHLVEHFLGCGNVCLSNTDGVVVIEVLHFKTQSD